jgi:hypothetical protein
MNKKDYRRAFMATKRELVSLLKRREQIDEQIAKLKPLVKDLAVLCEAKPDEELMRSILPSNVESMGITDLVRLALKKSSRAVTPIEVRNQVLFFRSDLSQQRNLLASVHTVLKRIVRNGEAEEVPGLGGKKAYKWVSDVARVLSSLRDVQRGAGFKK